MVELLVSDKLGTAYHQPKSSDQAVVGDTTFPSNFGGIAPSGFNVIREAFRANRVGTARVTAAISPSSLTGFVALVTVTS